jgi:hypothetical protein
MSLWEKYQLTFKRIVAILLATFVFFWMTKYEDITDPAVTLEHKCKIVLRLSTVPENVKNQCNNLIKDEYETEPN